MKTKNKPPLPLWLTPSLVALPLLCSMLLSGCSAWQKATSSQSWIDPPDTNVFVNIAVIRGRAKEAGSEITFLQAAGVYAMLGNVRSSGPADTDRAVEITPEGAIKMTTKTDNSTWLGGAFQGLWNTAYTVGDWAVKAAAGVAP